MRLHNACTNDKGANLPALISVVLATTIFVSSASAASPTIQLNELSAMTSVAELVARMGRPADVSEAGGACGGIVIHDWIAEKIRVIALGDFVQIVSTPPVQQ